MAENDLDSGQSDGTLVSPNTGSSEGSGDSKGSFDAAKLQATIESLTKRLDKVDERSKALQGDKDRGVNKTQEEVKELKRKIAEIEKLKKTGLDEDGAIEEHSFREEIRAVREQLARLNPVQTQTTGNREGLADEAAKLFAEYNVSPNDPEAIPLMELQGTDLIKAVSKLALKRANQPPPDSSEAGSLQGGPPAPAADQAKLISRLQELQKVPSKNRAEIAKITAQLGW